MHSHFALRRIVSLWGLVVCGLWVLSCTPPKTEDTDSGEESSLRLNLGEPVACDAPVYGIDRFHNEAAERGLTERMLEPIDVAGRHMIGRGGGVAVQDMDADGDLDLVVMKLDDGPWIYANDGNGYFALQSHTLNADLHEGQAVSALAAVDLNGDLLPEIVQVSGGMLQIFWNEGGLTFSQVDMQISEEPDESQAYLTCALGDLDGDGDLDMVLPSFGLSSTAGPNEDSGGPDRILLLEDRDFVHVMDLVVENDGSRTMVATFTDRDQDGDLDLFIPADRGPPSAFWQHDGIGDSGVPSFTNVSADLGADLVMSAMGIDSADLNGDGRLDYCISDIGLPKCLLSNAAGYAEGAASLGVDSELLFGTWGTVGWSLDLADMDNDGRLDMLQSSGPDGVAIDMGETEYPDLFWKGTEEGGFEEVTTETGFGNTGWNFGLATADLNGDGWLDVLVAGPAEPPILWMNQCGESSWLALDLIGPMMNTDAIGARVELDAGGRTHVREIGSLRGTGQTPSLLHFGLGEVETVDAIRVTWPGGEVSTLESLPTRRLLTLHHPDAAEAPWL